MKKSVILGFILVFFFTSLYGQDYKPWNVSLSFTPYWRYIIIAPATSRSFGERFELGFLPIFQYFKRKPDDNYNFKEKSFGLNFTGRYFIGRGQIMDPYVYSIIGYGINNAESSFSSSNTSDSYQSNFFNVTLMLGNEIKLGQKGWVFDFNVGLLGIQYFDYFGNFDVIPIYSFGIKKKFGIK